MANPQPFVGLRRKDISTAYVLLRILFGISFLITGSGKLLGVAGFAAAMVEQFKNTFIPGELVRLTAFLVPPVEVLVGLSLLLGLFTRVGLVTGFILMMVLHMGVTLLKDWNTAANQLIYCIIFFLLLAGAGFNAFSIDQWLARRRGETGTKDSFTSDIVQFAQRSLTSMFGNRRKASRKGLLPASESRR